MNEQIAQLRRRAAELAAELQQLGPRIEELRRMFAPPGVPEEIARELREIAARQRAIKRQQVLADLAADRADYLAQLAGLSAEAQRRIFSETLVYWPAGVAAVDTPLLPADHPLAQMNGARAVTPPAGCGAAERSALRLWNAAYARYGVHLDSPAERWEQAAQLLAAGAEHWVYASFGLPYPQEPPQIRRLEAPRRPSAQALAAPPST